MDSDHVSSLSDSNKRSKIVPHLVHSVYLFKLNMSLFIKMILCSRLSFG